MSQCRAYNERTDIDPDIFLNSIPINCGNCQRWNGERCGDEIVAVNMNNPELMREIVWCDS